MTPNWHGVTSGFVAPEEEVESFKMFQMPTVGKKDGCVAWYVRAWMWVVVCSVVYDVAIDAPSAAPNSHPSATYNQS